MNACIWYISKYVTRPPIGNVGLRGFLILRAMSRLGHRAVILTSDSSHLNSAPAFEGRFLDETVDGVTIRWIHTRKYDRALSVGRVLSWIDFEWQLFRLRKTSLPRPDVVIVSSLSLLTIFNGLWLRHRYGCRLVFEVRDIWPLTIIEEGGFSARNPLVVALRAVEKVAYRFADEIVGTMPNLQQHVDESMKQHAPVHCIPFGADAEMLEQSKPMPADWVEANIPKDRFLVCHAGTIGITNALDTLFACARAMKDHSDIHFLIVGEGGLRGHYEALCSDLPNVTFTGPVPKDSVLTVLGKCDLLYFSTHPSRVWNYGLSLNKVIDYMLAGKPITASYTGYPTMVEEAGAGTSVPAGDAAALKTEILRFKALPPHELQTIGERGRTWLLQNRSYQRLAEDYLALALRDRVVT